MKAAKSEELSAPQAVAMLNPGAARSLAKMFRSLRNGNSIENLPPEQLQPMKEQWLEERLPYEMSSLMTAEDPEGDEEVGGNITADTPSPKKVNVEHTSTLRVETPSFTPSGSTAHAGTAASSSSTTYAAAATVHDEPWSDWRPTQQSGWSPPTNDFPEQPSAESRQAWESWRSRWSSGSRSGGQGWRQDRSWPRRGGGGSSR